MTQGDVTPPNGAENKFCRQQQFVRDQVRRSGRLLADAAAVDVEEGVAAQLNLHCARGDSEQQFPSQRAPHNTFGYRKRVPARLPVCGGTTTVVAVGKQAMVVSTAAGSDSM